MQVLIGMAICVSILLPHGVFSAATGSSPSNSSPTRNRDDLIHVPNTGTGTGKQPKEPEYTVLTDNGNVSSEHPCHLHPFDVDLYEKIKDLHADGAKLITYNLHFDEYASNPLARNMTWNYRSYQWHRTFDSHGRTLLTLAFNYDVLSLAMLTFGVEELDIKLVDAPARCFPYMSEEAKIAAVLDLMTTDFQVHTKLGKIPGDDAHMCHQIIEEENGRGFFRFRCCRRRPGDDVIECTINRTGKWIYLLYVLIAVVKCLAFLFGAQFLQWFFHSESIRTTDYFIKLKDILHKTILVKKVKLPDEGGNKAKEVRQFKKFRKTVKSIPSEEIVSVAFEKLQVTVDQRKLMTEKSVPVGLFKFLSDTLFRCQVRQWKTFASCCKESIFGSWSPSFLWLPLKKQSECNTSCRTFLSYGHVFVIIGGLLILFAIPLPYYARVIIYFVYEEDEMNTRARSVETLGLKKPYDHNFLHLVSPTHPAMIFVYITYAVSFLLLAAVRECNAEKFDHIAVTAVQDLRHIRRTECVRLIVGHLLLPFEKFGLCGGLLVGVLYWSIAIPVCLLVSLAYCIPTVYLTGRFLIHSRPSFLYLKPRPTTPVRGPPKTRRYLSDGTSSFETCLLLENISPRNDIDLSQSRDACCRCRIDRRYIYTACLSWTIGLLCICFSWSILLMFAEVFGFVVEIFTFTMMGAIVNAGIAARYVMLAFWMLMYSTACYNNVYEEYMDLNKKIFECIKGKLGEDIRAVTLLREEKQKNTAFKYFSTGELQEQALNEAELEVDSDDDCDEDTAMLRREAKLTLPSDSIEYVKDKLHWRINCLIFFVDSKDVPRIPRELFHQICSIRAPGCPGPIYHSLIKATRQLFYMVLFLVFILIVIMSFGSIYKISTTNQLLVTVAGGFAPFIIRFVIQPKKRPVELGTYSFAGKVHHIIQNFSQIWPVFDLSFKVVPYPPEGATNVPDPAAPTDGNNPEDGMEGDNTATLLLPGRQPVTQQLRSPTHVDLLITIRDDCDYECDGANLRSEPGSHGSRASLNSANRPSPEEAHLMALNNPQTSNALRRTISTTTDNPSNESRRRNPGPTVATQTSGDRSRPPSFGQTSPGARPVDLMVDMVKGNVRVRNRDGPAENGGSVPGNGSPQWTQDSPYNRVSRDESESSV